MHNTRGRILLPSQQPQACQKSQVLRAFQKTNRVEAVLISGGSCFLIQIIFKFYLNYQYWFRFVEYDDNHVTILSFCLFNESCCELKKLFADVSADGCGRVIPQKCGLVGLFLQKNCIESW
uniref:Uncharacterized protein n=1 Tax=Micrurus spixii TaxID=129469 RepID=A0A2D4M7L2_9SAUR